MKNIVSNLGQVFQLKLVMKMTARMIPVVGHLLALLLPCYRPSLVFHLDDSLRPDGLVVQHHQVSGFRVSLEL